MKKISKCPIQNIRFQCPYLNPRYYEFEEYLKPFNRDVRQVHTHIWAYTVEPSYNDVALGDISSIACGAN
jgi:hypothetical protein